MGAPTVTTAFSTPSYSAVPLTARLVIATGAQYARVTKPSRDRGQKREWRRGNVTSFSARSRSRMLQSFAQIRQDRGTPDCLWITLTYPDWYPSSVRRCKAHLKAWEKRVTRAFPTAWFYWKLEYQVRGAPHFHLLVFDTGAIVEEWWHDAWFEVVNSGEHFHWFYGTKVDRLHSWRDAAGYCAKYTAKVDTPQVCDSPGRFWGIIGRKRRPATLQEAELTEHEFYQLRRLFRRYMGQRNGYHAPGGPDAGVWTRISAASAKRGLEWASSPRASPTRDSGPSHHVRAVVCDTPAACNGWNSTGGSAAGQRTTTDRNDDRTNERLFDSRDLVRRSARRLFA